MARNSARLEKWRNTPITQDNVDAYITDMIEGTSGRYINQGVNFSKQSSVELGLLKMVILEHGSFSGLVKHLLTKYFAEKAALQAGAIPQPVPQAYQIPPVQAAPAIQPFHYVKPQPKQEEQVAEQAELQLDTSTPETDAPAPKPTEETESPAEKDKATGSTKRKTTPVPPSSRQVTGAGSKPKRSGGGFAPNPNAKGPTDPS